MGKSDQCAIDSTLRRMVCEMPVAIAVEDIIAQLIRQTHVCSERAQRSNAETAGFTGAHRAEVRGRHQQWRGLFRWAVRVAAEFGRLPMGDAAAAARGGQRFEFVGKQIAPIADQRCVGIRQQGCRREQRERFAEDAMQA